MTMQRSACLSSLLFATLPLIAASCTILTPTRAPQPHNPVLPMPPLAMAGAEPEPGPEPGPDAEPPSMAQLALPNQPPRWRRTGAYRCSGNQRLRLARLQIESPDDGLTVSGGCSVILEDSRIVAAGYGIRVIDRGRVTLRRSAVRGDRGAVYAAGSAGVAARQTVFWGDVALLDSASYRDLGNNSFRAGGLIRPGPVTLPKPPVPAPQPEPPRPLKPVAPTPVRDGLQPSGPIRCQGKQVLRLSKLHITSPRYGISARGRCKVLLTDSEIAAETVAIRVSGNASVTVRRTRVQGAQGSVWLDGRATLIASQSLFVGPLRREGGAAYRDKGGNQWRERRPKPLPPVASPAPTPATPRPELQPSGPIACKGNETLRLERLRIAAPKHGLVVTGRCRVVITDSVIQAGKYGIEVRGAGRVTVRRSRVEGQKGAVRIGENGALQASKTVFRGELYRAGAGVFRDDGGNTWR